MASVHITVSVQTFNGLEHGMVGEYFFCAHSPEGEGLVETLERLFEEETFISWGHVYAW